MLGAFANVETGSLKPARLSGDLKNSTLKKSANQRMDWPDIAKGLSILGVVLLHVTMAIPEAENTFVAQLNLLLDPLRMPLFFLVSGFFAVKVLNQSFSQLFRGRLWFYAVPYLCWVPVNLYAFNLEANLAVGRPFSEIDWYLESILSGENMYWFLFMLVLFNIALWATKKLPAWTIAAVVLAPWLFMPVFSELELVRKSLIYMPAFFIGAYFRPLISKFAASATQATIVVFAFALYVAGLAVGAFADSIRNRESYGLTMQLLIRFKDAFATSLGGQLTPADLDHIPAVLIRLFSLPIGIVLCVWLAKIGPVKVVLKFLGRHTLPIYIGHALGLTLIFRLGLRPQLVHIDNTSPNMWQWSGTWMLIAFVCALLGSYIVYLISRIPIVGWTVVPPRLPASKLMEETKLKIAQRRENAQPVPSKRELSK